MSPLQGILAGYAVQLVALAFALALVPFIRFATRRAELYNTVSPQQRAELYPLEHSVVFDLLVAMFSLAFLFERWLKSLGWNFVEYLAQAAPFLFVLLCAYRFIRSLWLLRHLPASELAARSYVRSTMITSGIAGLIVSLLLPAILRGDQ